MLKGLENLSSHTHMQRHIMDKAKRTQKSSGPYRTTINQKKRVRFVLSTRSLRFHLRLATPPPIFHILQYPAEVLASTELHDLDDSVLHSVQPAAT